MRIEFLGQSGLVSFPDSGARPGVPRLPALVFGCADLDCGFSVSGLWPLASPEEVAPSYS